MTRRLSALARAAALLTLSVLGGCSGGGGHADPAPNGALDPRLPPLADVHPRTPMVRGDVPGLEAHWWVVNDADLDVARTLSRYETDPAGEPLELSAAISAWRANGLRLARVPLDDYVSLREAMPPSRTFQRVWIGPTAEWRELLRGRSAGGERRMLIEGRLTQLPPGTLRLLARAWVLPSPDGPRLRVEAVPQLDLPDPGQMHQLFEQIDRPPDLSQRAQGVTLDDLRLPVNLRDGEMLVVTADRPGADWAATPPPRAEQVAALESETDPEGEATPDGAIPWDPSGRAHPQGAGPRSSRALTIGESMLASSPEEVSYGSPKVVLVLIPRLPDRFRLLANRADEANPSSPAP